MRAASKRKQDLIDDIGARVASTDWARVAADLDEAGWALLSRLLTTDECAELAGLYASDGHFRSTVVMARHGFGRGEYKYFAYPLPPIVAALRPALYAAARTDRQSLERGDGHRRALSAHA